MNSFVFVSQTFIPRSNLRKARTLLDTFTRQYRPLFPRNESDRDTKSLAALLTSSSKTFAFTIPQHGDPKLTNPVSFCYLIDRAIDELEVLVHPHSTLQELKDINDLGMFFLDVMAVPDNPSITELKSRLEKVPVKKKGYRKLFDSVSFLADYSQRLPENVREPIIHYARKMVSGFTDPNIQDIRTIEDHNRYCHRAAGLVGLQYTKILESLGIITSETRETLMPYPGLFNPGTNPANDFGMALQKTNDTKDLHEDYANETFRWPRILLEENGLESFDRLVNPANSDDLRRSYSVLKEMISKAVELFPKAMEYVSKIPEDAKGPRIFCFDTLMMSAAVLRSIDSPEFFTTKGKIGVSLGEILDIDQVVKCHVDNRMPLNRYLNHLLVDKKQSQSYG